LNIVGRDGIINDKGTGYMVKKEGDGPKFQDDVVIHQDIHSPDHSSILMENQHNVHQNNDRISEEK